MANIRFIDSIMGSGKTSAIIKEINSNYMTESYLYVTPFLRETQRIKDSCEQALFSLPDNQHGSKVSDLEDLIDSGVNVSMSHQLLKCLSKKQMSSFNNYHLILDETLDLISIYTELKKKDLELLLDKKFIEIGDDGLITMTQSGREEIFKFSAYEKVANLINEEKLYLYGGKTCILELPIEIITSFKKVTIMSYLVEGSYLYQMLRYKGNHIEKKCISRDNEIVDYDIELEKERAKSAYNKISLYVGNGGGRDYNIKMSNVSSTLSYSKQSKWTTRDKVSVGNVIRSWFRNVGATADTALYSNFGDGVPVKSFETCFLSYNARATNDYADKTHLAYIIDKNPNPALVNYCKDKYNITVNEDMLTLDAMLQWIFRSKIRCGGTINLFLPSLKMRQLLNKWGNNFDKLL